eukprot:m.46847 g.46847  ORF g.46847 m.46847 type:complete len:1126 (-) comp10946_c0_seq4:1621-4998(-)
MGLRVGFKMKNRFSTLDLQAVLAELRPRLLGMRLANFYDINSKTYLLKFAKSPQKAMVLIESGIRIHSTEYEWPKSHFPSGFAMKCRKHLRTRRLTEMQQLGVDRILDLSFGSGEAQYHLIVEFYDRGNIILADCDYQILSLLRVRTDDSDVRFAVGERYPLENVKQPSPLTMETLTEAFSKAKPNEPLRKRLNPIMECGGAVIEHCLREVGFPPNAKTGKDVNLETDIDRVFTAMQMAEVLLLTKLQEGAVKGIILVNRTKRPQKPGEAASAEPEEITSFDDVVPFPMLQYADKETQEYESFDRAMDVYFSEVENQKITLRALQQEQSALKRIEQAKESHRKHVEAYQQSQLENAAKAYLVEMNLELVDSAIRIISSMVANKLDWREIDDLVKEAKARGDPVASHISKLNLKKNMFFMSLTYDDDSDTDSSTSDEESDEEEEQEKASAKPKKEAKAYQVEIDLDETAYGNACKLYANKKTAKVKEMKAIDATDNAVKAAVRKTQQQLQKAQQTTGIVKARKPYWFERFFWFISSENYLVIAGRDRQQNELLVRRHLVKGDVYVHADLHGASSVVVKNPGGGEIPPKTLLEAGNMAVNYSVAWTTKVISNAWWVYNHQVSKTAPSGEYLSTGSFMIRGKKNYLPPVQLVIGYAMLFRVDESSIARHIHERRRKNYNGEGDEASADASAAADSVGQSQFEKEAAKELMRAAKAERRRQRREAQQAAESGAEGEAESDAEGMQEQEDQDGEKKEDGVASEVEGDAQTDDQADEEEEATNDLFPDVSLQYSVSATGVSISAEPSSVPPTPTEEVPQVTKPTKQPSSKPRMSAKQRRDARKKKQQGEDASDETVDQQDEATVPDGDADEGDGIEEGGSESEDDVDDEEDASTSQKQSKSQASKPKQKQQPAGRGQRRRNKKKNAKYQDQDEEDRALMMQLLAPDGKQLTRKQKRQQRKEKGKASKQAVIKGAQGKELPSQEVLSKLSQTTKQLASAAAASTHGISADDGIIDGGDVQSEIREIMDEEHLVALDAEDKADLTYLDALTGKPHPDDDLLFAIPMVAPYQALNGYKYRAKLVPGSSKQGKVIRSVVHNFTAPKSTPQREVELIKSIKDIELFGNLPGKVKAM